MRNRAIKLLLLALLLGFASVWMAQTWLRQQLALNTGPSGELRKVVVAVAPVDFGSRLGREHLREVEWPARSIPAQSFSSIDALVGEGQERLVLRPIEANEPILSSKITAPGGRATLSTVLAKDHRAVTIRVNDVLGVAGFVLPGDRVDVLLTRGRESDRADTATDILLQNVRVLGIDQEASERRDKPTVAKAVTLEVSPDQAQVLTLGSQVGSLSLALRNHSDQAALPPRTVTLADLRGARPEPEKAPVAARPRGTGQGMASVQVMRGTTPATVQVQREGALLAAQ